MVRAFSSNLSDKGRTESLAQGARRFQPGTHNPRDVPLSRSSLPQCRCPLSRRVVCLIYSLQFPIYAKFTSRSFKVRLLGLWEGVPFH